ncbi:NADAR family protein [Streptomyces sp. AK02-01A]|uniref:NADAR family protein n=1 Tax=Streptomyces sp. AK02-01A TaxID=3028648 RepID=UPI0029BC112D|nr:NADAR family protein [Streptomyces sp. AK02-01A]MDX3854386.1 NADAR family protein [Streptomyces sp. AK02-01A]
MSVVTARLACMGTHTGSTGNAVRTVAELVGRAERGERLRYLRFWGHAPRQDGTLGPSCLSQWWPAPFTVEDVEYATAEHWMMAAKARLFGDAEAERLAVGAANPALAKKAGRLVRDFDEAVWKRERYGIVLAGSVHKFGQDAGLRGFLLATGGRILVEASPMDRIWGIGLAAADERAEDPARWRGLNLLGFALMEARERLRAKYPASGADAAPERGQGVCEK